jgi:arylsulfatase A-like enzyme
MILTRRSFLAGAALASRAAPAKRPNVLVFMSDQESALLPGPVKLPNRQRLLDRGVRFTSAFCNTPQCSAARSSLLTGLEPNQTGVLTNVDGSSLGKPLPVSLPNVGSVFRKAGYTTGYFGKWHLGNDDQGLEKYGFSTYFRGRDEAAARQAAEWIRKQSGPWLAWVSVINPHNIYSIPRVLKTVRPRAGVQPPHSDLSNLAGKPAEQRWFVDEDQGRQTRDFTTEDWIRYRSFYCELTEKVDACLGTVLDAVKDFDSTVAVYTSDHGDALGEHGLPYKGPFMYEELIRVPLVIAAPGAFSHPQTRDDLVRQADLAPTLAELAGLAWPGKTSGQSLAGKPLSRDAVLLEYFAKQKQVNPIRTIRTRRWKFNWYDRGNKELYDLTADPHELHNRAGDAGLRRLQRNLETRLNAWRGPLM